MGWGSFRIGRIGMLSVFGPAWLERIDDSQDLVDDSDQPPGAEGVAEASGRDDGPVRNESREQDEFDRAWELGPCSTRVDEDQVGDPVAAAAYLLNRDRVQADNRQLGVVSMHRGHCRSSPWNDGLSGVVLSFTYVSLSTRYGGYLVCG